MVLFFDWCGCGHTPRPDWLAGLSVSVDPPMSLPLADVVPAHPLHPQSAPEEDPLLYLPADPAAAAAVHVRHVPHPLHEDDIPAAHDTAHPRQVSRLRQPPSRVTVEASGVTVMSSHDAPSEGYFCNF